MATGVGRGRICLTSFNSPTTKTHNTHNNLRDISYTSRVVVDFVSNFVAMTIVVGCGGIFLTSLNSPTPKPPVMCKNISHKSRVIAYFDQISLLWQQGSVMVELVWYHSIARPWKPPTGARISEISLIQAQLQWTLCAISLPWQQGSSRGKFKWHR